MPSANGASLDIPPPPLFIVAAQQEYEEKAAPHDPPASHDPPPPPPRYVPGPAPQVTPPPKPVAHVSAGGSAVVLFQAVPSPAPSPVAPAADPKARERAPFLAKASISTSRLKAVPQQPPTLVGLSDSSSPPPSLPHSASPAGPPVRPSSFPPDDAGWDVSSVPSKEVPSAAPSETLAGARFLPPVAGMDANTGVDIAKLSLDDAERILAGGPSHPTVHGVPALSQPALPPPPPLRASSMPPTLLQGGGIIQTPAFGSIPTVTSPSATPARARSTTPPPLRRRGQTLMLYGGAPRETDSAEEAKVSDSPPINVPAPGAQAPKAVTQAPPWTGESKLDPTIPRLPPTSVPQIRPMMDSVEEISGSVLLPEDSGADVTARRQKIEDLSSSHVLPDASGSAPQLSVAALEAAMLRDSSTLHGEPAPPPVKDPFPSVEPAVLPPTELPLGTSDDPSFDPSSPVVPASPSHRIVHDLNEVWNQPRKRLVAAAWAGGTLVVLFLAVTLSFRLFGGQSADGSAAASSPVVSAVAAQPASAGSASVAPSTEPTAAAHGGGPGASSRAPCVLSGSAHVIAPKALVRMGIETAASQSRLGLGFVTSDKDGLAVALDPSSLSAVATAKQRGRDPLKRIVPQLGSGKGVVAVADTDRKGDRIVGARTVPEGPFVLGSADGKLVWAGRASEAPRPLWALDSDAPVEALRAVPLEDGGYAVAFREGGAIYVGAFAADKSTMGALSRIAGLGPQIGSPALGVSGETASVVWADRASTSDPWMLRVVRWHAGQSVGEAQPFAIPPGGLGEQAMSPGITGVAGGRFLLSWTEGPVSSHQVRAQTLAVTGEVLGPPLTISGEGVNAGQGQPAFLADGRGLVVYMGSPSGATAQVVATPIVCPLSQP